MQIRNAIYDRQLDILDCRATMLGFDLYNIKSEMMFAHLMHRCFNCSLKEACAMDLRRDPNDPAWTTYCPNAATLERLAEDLRLAQR